MVPLVTNFTNLPRTAAIPIVVPAQEVIFTEEQKDHIEEIVSTLTAEKAAAKHAKIASAKHAEKAAANASSHNPVSLVDFDRDESVMTETPSNKRRIIKEPPYITNATYEAVENNNSSANASNKSNKTNSTAQANSPVQANSTLPDNSTNNASIETNYT